MNRLILILILKLVSTTIILCQHSLYHEGATWIATHESNCGIGYEIYTYAGDTAYKGNTIKIVEHFVMTFSYELGDYYEGRKTREYFMQRGNELYKIGHNFTYIDSVDYGPRLIFDYGAQAGDTMIHVKRMHPKTNTVRAVLYTIIDSLKEEPIDGSYFKTWYGRYYQSNSKLKNTTVVYNERIGEMTQFPLLPRSLVMSKDFPDFPDLVYYTDNTGFEYDPYDEYKNILEMQEQLRRKEKPVDSTSGVPDEIPGQNEQLRLSPNPATDYIELELPGEFNQFPMSYEIHKMACGSKCASGILDNTKIRIDISSLESGLYLVLIKRQNNFRFVERFVKI